MRPGRTHDQTCVRTEGIAARFRLQPSMKGAKSTRDAGGAKRSGDIPNHSASWTTARPSWVSMKQARSISLGLEAGRFAPMAQPRRTWFSARLLAGSMGPANQRDGRLTRRSSLADAVSARLVQYQLGWSRQPPRVCRAPVSSRAMNPDVVEAEVALSGRRVDHSPVERLTQVLLRKGIAGWWSVSSPVMIVTVAVEQRRDVVIHTPRPVGWDSRRTDMSWRTRAVRSITCAAALISIAACTTGRSEAGQSTQSRGPAKPRKAAAATAPSTAQSSLRKPPELESDTSLAGRQEVSTGNAVVPYRKGKKGDALTISVSCQGEGKMTVVVQPVHVSFPLACRAPQVTTITNQVAVSGAELGGAVSVEASPAVRWSMTIGRGRPAEAEPQGAE
ncbi:hypothetical protein QFZ66_008390 [Streptomyces sp. B4I13]|nr:hypothetical protein [Streptomyces sp. B4I13]